MAAPAIVLGFIARKGLQAAIKKFGKASVQAAKQAAKKIDKGMRKVDKKIMDMPDKQYMGAISTGMGTAAGAGIVAGKQLEKRGK